MNCEGHRVGNGFKPFPTELQSSMLTLWAVRFIEFI